MTKTQKKIARYILSKPSEVVFLNVEQLAQRVGVSEASIVRFATSLGLKGYSDLHQKMQAEYRAQITLIERLNISSQVYDHVDLYQLFRDEMRRIQMTMEGIDADVFNRVVDALIGARRVMIVGHRSAYSLAQFFVYYLRIVLDQPVDHVGQDRAVEAIYGATNDDVMVALSFTRYARETVRVLEKAKQHGLRTVVITDHLLSPLVPHAELTLLAATQVPSFIDSFVAPLSVINAILITIGQKRAEAIQKKLMQMETLWKEFDVFI